MSALKVDEVEVARRALFESGLLPHSGRMVDVGAHKGSSFSPFVRSGWDVWAFEPSTALFGTLVERFGHWQNLQLFNIAISDTVMEAAAFFTSEVSAGISSLLDFHDSHEFAETVATRRLDMLGLDHLDFLKIDAEGYDRNIFRSPRRGSIVPKVLVTEFEDAKTLLLGYTAGQYAEELTAAGYHVWVSEWNPIVRYGGDHSWKCMYRYSGAAPDQSAWGNFIAVHNTVGVHPEVIETQLLAELPDKLDHDHDGRQHR